MTLSDLRRSITDMSDYEAIQLIGKIRENRRKPRKTTIKSHAAIKKKNAEVRTYLKTMTRDEAAELIKLLERK